MRNYHTHGTWRKHKIAKLSYFAIALLSHQDAISAILLQCSQWQDTKGQRKGDAGTGRVIHMPFAMHAKGKPHPQLR